MLNRTNGFAQGQLKKVEYLIIGAGPAAITTIPSLIKSGVNKDSILWIDPEFKVGNFGTTLSVGSSVPGNTAVEAYQTVNRRIYEIVKQCAPDRRFAIDEMDPGFVCTLKVATEPMQHITDRLRSVVPSIEGKVTHINSTQNGLTVEIASPDGSSQFVDTKRAIMATGAEPKTLKLPHDVTVIEPNTAFIQTELAQYLSQHPGIHTVAVIGSSHSAALASMHLLKAGLNVKQFMNKDYLFATPQVSAEGVKYTQYDNTGLKGDVAKFTKQLLDDMKKGTGEFKGKLTIYKGKNTQEVEMLMKDHLTECSHVVQTIGYKPADTLTVNGKPLASLVHNNKTTEFKDVKGLFGIGVGFPLEVKAISGEVEPAVGVGKFWATANKSDVLERWKNNTANFQNVSLATSRHAMFRMIPITGVSQTVQSNERQARPRL